MTGEPQEYIISGDLLDRVERALKYSGKNELAAEFGAIRNCFVSHSLANTNTKAMPSPAQPSGDVLRSDKVLETVKEHLDDVIGGGLPCGEDVRSLSTYCAIRTLIEQLEKIQQKGRERP